MSVTIPRNEIHDIGRRHNVHPKRYHVDYDIDFDPSVAWVRATAKHLRGGGDFIGSAPVTVLAEADDLDALADRYEKETTA